MSWYGKLVSYFERPIEENPIDKAIVDNLPHEGEVQKVYQARWVWYHTLLAIELLFTNIFLFILIVITLVK